MEKAIEDVDVRVSIDRSGFLWRESDAVTKKFFDILRNREREFCPKKLAEMASFYTGDVEKVFDVTATVTRNGIPIKKGDVVDVSISMFIEGRDACSRIRFFLNDYGCREISAASEVMVRDRAEIKKFSVARAG